MGSSTENNFYSSVVCTDGEAVVSGAQVAWTKTKGFGTNVPWIVHVTSRATIKTRYLASLDGVVNTDAIIAIRVK